MTRTDFNLIQVFTLVVMQVYEVQIKWKRKRRDQHFPLCAYGSFWSIASNFSFGQAHFQI